MAIKLDVNRWPHISLNEVACRCKYADCKYKTVEQVLAAIDTDILDFYEELRATLGNTPLHINSGIRCDRHNKDVGGVKHSPHKVWTYSQVAKQSAISKFFRLEPSIAAHHNKISFALDIAIRGHFIFPEQMRDFVRYEMDEWFIRIGWMKYNSFCHFDYAFNLADKNKKQEQRWKSGVEW